MIRSLVDWSLQAPILIVVIAAVAVFFGAGRLSQMPVDVYPEFAPVTVEVRAEALGLSANEVAELVTVPLEADLLSNVPWVDIIRSESVPGLSSVELIFEPGTDLLKARQVTQERVSEAAVALAGASKPPEILQPRSSTGRVMMIGLSSDSLSLIDLSVLARWNIRPRLLGVEGVSNVAIWGQREKQLQVLVNPARLENLRVPLLQVIESTANALWASPLTFVEASVPGTGGWIDTPNQRIGIQHVSPIESAADLAQVTLEERPAVKLSDLATIVQDHQPLIGDAVLRDGLGLVIVVEKWPEANTQEVTAALDEAIAAIKSGLPGVEMDAGLYRPATYVDDSISNIALVAVIAAVLVILTLAAFLFDWRTALMAAVTIPLTLFAAVLALDLLGEGMNLIVLGGLVVALVFVIDDAVLSADGLWRRLRANADAGEPTTSVIGDAFAATHGPLIFGSLVALIVLVPLFFLNGLAGEFFPSIALAYGAALVVSTLISLIVAPALALLLFPTQPKRYADSPVAASLLSLYRPALRLALANPLPVAAITAVAALVAIGLATQLSEPSLLPQLKERNVVVEWQGRPGTSLGEMTRVVTQVTRQIGELDGVANVGSHIGRAITSDQVVDVNSAQIWLTIDPDADYDATLDDVQGVVDGYADFERTVITYPERQVRDILTGSARDVVVRVYGEDYDALRTEAGKVKTTLAGIGGIVDPQIDLPEEQDTIEVTPKLSIADQHGLKPGDVRRQSATLISGLLVGNLFEEQKVFEVVVWTPPELRNSVAKIGELKLDTPRLTYVTLSEAADIRVEKKPTSVKRESVSRYLDVTANVDGRGIGAVEDDIRDQLQTLNFPVEYHAEVVTEKATGYRFADTSILPYLAVAAVGAFLLLQAAFGSWRVAALTLVLLPAALVGGVLAALIDGGDVTIGSYIGFVALFGLSGRNGVALVGRYLAAEHSGDGAFTTEQAVAIAEDRALPVVTTAGASILAMLVVIVAGAMAGLEVVRPLAIVMAGGLITSTLVSMLVLPAVYLKLWRHTEPDVSLA